MPGALAVSAIAKGEGRVHPNAAPTAAPRGDRARSVVPTAASVLVLVPGLLLGVEAANAVGRAAVAPPEIRGTFGAAVRAANGHVSTVQTIVRLRRLHVNTYAFLVKEKTDWDDLRLRFAPAAQKAGLKVWVYLLPPRSCPPKGEGTCSGYVPFQKDYLAWVTAIANLSLRFPVVSAWAIDDFDHSLDFFTPDYMNALRERARSTQPRLEFYPVVYHDAISTSFVNEYARYFDAVIMPYRDDPYRNTLWTATLRSQLDDASELLERYGRQVVLMVYAAPLSNTTVSPDVGYVREVTSVGLQYGWARRIAGVIQYLLPLTPGLPQRAETGARTGKGAGVVTVDGGQATSSGDWAAASTWIVLDSGSTSCRMVLWHTDNRSAPSPAGYHFKQALVAGRTVWERDVASEATDWYTSAPLDLTELVSRGPAQLMLRLYERRGVSNYRVRVRFDDVTLSGCHTTGDRGFERSGHAWMYSRRGGPVIAGHHTADPTYSTQVFRTIAALYAT